LFIFLTHNPIFYFRILKPPVVVTPYGSDGSSSDNNARGDHFDVTEDSDEPIRFTTDMAPIHFLPSSGFDPVCDLMGGAPQIETYPMVSAGSHSNVPQSWSMQGQSMANGTSSSILNWEFLVESNAAGAAPTAVKTPRSAEADHILDDAVNQIFNSGPLPEDIASLDDLWDSTTFCDETVQDDTQLGFLLDQFLEKDD
jgi:hypothetical protein